MIQVDFVFIQDGDRVPRRGYWGDILVSPYLTFGIESDNKEFFKKGNNQFIYVSYQDMISKSKYMSVYHHLGGYRTMNTFNTRGNQNSVSHIPYHTLRIAIS